MRPAFWDGQVLDLREEDRFNEARVRGSHNIPVGSLWADNRWCEQQQSMAMAIDSDISDGHNDSRDSGSDSGNGNGIAMAVATPANDRITTNDRW